MKQKNKLTVSVGATAFNEEKNIKGFLESVCLQKLHSIEISEIIVISDGSTDHTVKLAKEITDSRIKIQAESKRLGLSVRHQQLFTQFTGDVLVIFDADTILKDFSAIEKLVKKFKTNNQIGLVAGNPQPLPAQTFIESAINNFLIARELFRSNYNFKNSGQACRGPIMAFSRKFAKRLTFPANLIADDAFSYLACKTQGFKFYFEPSAVVWFRSPQTIKDYVAQASRFLAGKPQLYAYFDKALVDSQYQIPQAIQIKIMLRQFVSNPLGYIFLKILFSYASWQSKPYLNKFNIGWDQISSTKRL